MLIQGESANFKDVQGFIVLEGVNGAGKTTLQKAIAGYLEKKGKRVISTREPGATPLGLSIRQLVLEPKEKPSQLAELFLFAADRAEHVCKVIEPAIERHDWVVSDRYYYSTIAFQGYGRGLPLPMLQTLMEQATLGLKPDLVILLDLDPKIGLNRTSKREASQASGGDTFETETLAFHERIRHGFLEIARDISEPCLVLDASLSSDEIFSAVVPYLDKLLNK